MVCPSPTVHRAVHGQCWTHTLLSLGVTTWADVMKLGVIINMSLHSHKKPHKSLHEHECTHRYRQMVCGDCVSLPEQRHDFPYPLPTKFWSPHYNAISTNLAFETDSQNTEMPTITKPVTPNKLRASVGWYGRLASRYHHLAIDILKVINFWFLFLAWDPWFFFFLNNGLTGM